MPWMQPRAREWNADTDFDVRLQDVLLTNRRPDVVVYRADTIDIAPTRPERPLLVGEVVSPGSETTDRIVKVDQYAKVGIGFYWRIEQAATGVPLVYTYVLDPARKSYRDGGVHRRPQGSGPLPGGDRPRPGLTRALLSGRQCVSDA